MSDNEAARWLELQREKHRERELRMKIAREIRRLSRWCWMMRPQGPRFGRTKQS